MTAARRLWGLFAAALVVPLSTHSWAAPDLSVPRSQLSRPDFSPEFAYGHSRPWVGIQLSASKSGLGDSSIHPQSQLATAQSIPIRLQIDFEPVQTLGVFSFGPSLEYQAQLPNPKWLPSSPLLLAWAAGGQIRYQARFSDRQWVIPTAAYLIQSWTYKTAFSEPGQFIAQGPSAGLWINLSSIDRQTSQTAAKDLGVLRTYLTLDWSRIEGSSSDYALSGDSFHFGVRFEI